MNCNPTLTADEFKTVHNSLCELRSLASRMMHSMIKVDEVERIIGQFEQGLKGAYEQDHVAFDTKFEHYRSVTEDLGLSTIWSIYEVDNLNDRHPYAGADRVVYKDHWGEKPVQASINGMTWAALYVAANACIRDSGDEHHIYIEQFRPSKDDPRTLILTTGS